MGNESYLMQMEYHVAILFSYLIECEKKEEEKSDENRENKDLNNKENRKNVQEVKEKKGEFEKGEVRGIKTENEVIGDRKK